VAGSLGGGWLKRRRFVKELEHHLEDSVAELREAGMPEDAAVRDAMSRLGGVETIVDAARATRCARSMSWRTVGRVPIAWIAVGAMSIVTFAAAELPQASGAKVPGPPLTHATRVVHAPWTGREAKSTRADERCRGERERFPARADRGADHGQGGVDGRRRRAEPRSCAPTPDPVIQGAKRPKVPVRLALPGHKRLGDAYVPEVGG
jgi:hypothetical protein